MLLLIQPDVIRLEAGNRLSAIERMKETKGADREFHWNFISEVGSYTSTKKEKGG